MNKKEEARIEKKQVQILNALRNAGNNGITNVELSEIALRYGGYLGKLYEQGYKIDRESVGEKGVHKYILVSEPQTILVREKAMDKLLSAVRKEEIIDVDGLIKILNDNNIAVKYKANTYK
ncbi:hypothetical protein PQE75_gp189 [Bacillus phage vB_BcoS-136]|uniref:Uncharacterized protein n=1 Tax=Bacillus phage vB_BcoS-136 TaxID=2419619 RepID=A0A3G3BVX2_9CAUD|nr:hypothetical protein PQE75_gp189 [Bacillus phage vB_BcoS-136]AYP68290.1 hypothetical protein vBBcoS136_00176 [Bacillus phage vB_BcoS-136]